MAENNMLAWYVRDGVANQLRKNDHARWIEMGFVLKGEETPKISPPVALQQTEQPKTDIKEMSVSELRDALEQLGLDTGGKKAELLERLNNANA